MPRTKRPARSQEKSTVIDDTSTKLNKLVSDQKHKLDFNVNLAIRNVELAFKILLGNISDSKLQKKVGELKSELLLKETTNTLRPTTRHSSRSASHDDGYLTENSSQGSGERRPAKHQMAPPSASRTVGRRSRSADASVRSALKSSAKTVQRRRSRSVYRTPAYNRNAPVNYPAITPKVAPHTPLTVLRQPRQGEMVVSMSGSPVMVPSCYSMQPDDKANCNILLQDGTMLSLQPKQLRQSQAFIPFELMDTDVLRQLRTLKDNLDKVVRLGEREYVK